MKYEVFWGGRGERGRETHFILILPIQLSHHPRRQSAGGDSFIFAVLVLQVAYPSLQVAGTSSGLDKGNPAHYLTKHKG